MGRDLGVGETLGRLELGIPFWDTDRVPAHMETTVHWGDRPSYQQWSMNMKSCSTCYIKNVNENNKAARSTCQAKIFFF